MLSKWLLIFTIFPYCASDGGVELKLKWKEKNNSTKVTMVCLKNEDIRVPVYKREGV